MHNRGGARCLWCRVAFRRGKCNYPFGWGACWTGISKAGQDFRDWQDETGFGLGAKCGNLEKDKGKIGG